MCDELQPSMHGLTRLAFMKILILWLKLAFIHARVNGSLDGGMVDFIREAVFGGGFYEKTVVKRNTSNAFGHVNRTIPPNLQIPQPEDDRRELANGLASLRMQEIEQKPDGRTSSGVQGFCYVGACCGWVTTPNLIYN